MTIITDIPTRKPFRQPFLRLLILLFATAYLLSGCGYSDDESADTRHDDANTEAGAEAPDYASSYAAQAESALANNQVSRARNIYTTWHTENPASGQAAAGLAITDLLLLLDSQPATKILIENLGARQAIDSTDTIYGPDSFLYWLSRGTSWADQGQYQGIYSLLGSKLPWTKYQLESLVNFVDNLNQPINLLLPNLISLADLLQNIEETLQISIDDPAFTRIFIPGELLHDARLSLTLSASEISFLQSALATARAAIHFVSAYQHDWTLAKAFGAWRTNPGQAEDAPLFVPAFGANDYSIRYLDQHLFREVTRPEQLLLARLALTDGLQYAQKSIQFGLKSQHSYLLQWEKIDATYLQNMLKLLQALEQALVQPTPLPFTTPPTSADFSPFFNAQKSLTPTLPWMQRVDQNNEALPDESTAEGNWIMNPTAKKAFFHIDVYTPLPSHDAPFPSLEIDSPYHDLLIPLLSTYLEYIEDAFLLAR